MPDLFDQLLDAAIEHLEELRAGGARFVNVSPQALNGLRQSAVKGAPAKPVAPVWPGRAVVPQTPNPAPIASTGGALPLGSEPVAPKSAPATPVIAAAGLSAAARAEAFAELRQRVLSCRKCAHLAAARKTVVFGVGDLNARLMYVGEAPGADEDEQGEPFVGKAGQLLTRIIQTMGLSRGSVYIANILKCRPDTPGQAAGNRKPTAEEMQTCIPYLHEQIDLIGPKVIVALGATAVEGLLGKTIGITRLRGQWRTYRGIPLMPTYHPAYLLRNQALSEKRRVWEDMLQVMERLELPISQKQRNYFV